MKTPIESLRAKIEPLRQQIIQHKVYGIINTPEELQIFMQFHVYAVWDFMSLLKTLQNNLTCTSIPWFPVGEAASRYLINEIVTGEEADVDPDGNRKSHYELYLEAMKAVGADTLPIEKFTSTLQYSRDFEKAFTASSTPRAAKSFVSNTFAVIDSNKDYLQSAVFTFGREDLIPNMFLSIVNDMHAAFPESVSLFKYYLERHIEVDGDHHSQLALQMTELLCGKDEKKWKESEAAVMESLQRRIELWDAVYDAIVERSLV